MMSADIKKKIDNEPVYNFLKTKIKFHSDEVTDFYDKEIPKADSNRTCLAVTTFLTVSIVFSVNKQNLTA